LSYPFKLSTTKEESGCKPNPAWNCGAKWPAGFAMSENGSTDKAAMGLAQA
jgi:hypothetical protein